MARATITGRPDIAVSKLCAPVRQSNSRQMKAAWIVPAGLKADSNPRRAEKLKMTWYLGVPGKDVCYAASTTDTSASHMTIDLNNLRFPSATLKRDSFYPLHPTRKLTYVSIIVQGANSKGDGKAVRETRNFTVPRVPTINNWSFNGETGTISTTINTNAGADYQERYDTRYIVTVENSRTGEKWNQADNKSTKTSFNVSYDAPDYQQLTYDEYVKVTATAWARGYAGDSAKATKTFYVSYPAKATIEGIDVPSTSLDDKCTIRINTNHTEAHPVDRVKLQYVANSDYDNASNIPANDWSTSDIIDDKDCTALSLPVADLVSQPGKHTWVRVKSYHAHEAVLFRYSDAMEVTQMFSPAHSAVDEEITILNVEEGNNANSAIVTLGWNADGTDDATGTELSWSTDENTWKSTESPSIHNFTWSDGRYPETGELQYHDSARITIKGLDEGSKYYVKARRYLEGETTTYSPYSNTAVILPNQKPESIVATCERYIPEGEPLSVKWTFSGYEQQKSWEIDSTDGVVIASGDGSVSSTQISAERLASVVTNGSVTFTVKVSTGSSFVVSEEQTVSIVDAPVLSITIPSTLTGQDENNPLTFSATATTVCDLIVVITSQGAMGQFPQGILTQTAGDTIHSDVYSPAWGDYELTEDSSIVEGKTYYTRSGTGTAEDPYVYDIVDEPDVSEIGTYYEFVSSDTANVSVPSGLDFWDGGNYTIDVTAVDRTTGLRSEKKTGEFTVEWTNKAVDPTDGVQLTVIDTTDEEGDHTQAVQIDLTPPTGSSATDVYDIYRMDVGNPSLIGEGFPLTHTTIDEYAPFGEDVELKYRVAIRTIDGDEEFTDITYQADCKNLRFDWADGYLELPYGLTLGDSYDKDVEIRKHLNGTNDGYWNKNITRKSSLSSDVIKIVQPKDIEKARLLGRYTGPVFVRKPDGSAFEADVQVTDLSKKNEAVAHVAFDATEIRTTQEFMLPEPYVVDQDEEE